MLNQCLKLVGFKLPGLWGTQASAVTTRWAGTVCCGHQSGWWCHSVEACGVRAISRSQPALGLGVHSLHWASVSTACTALVTAFYYLLQQKTVLTITNRWLGRLLGSL